MKFLPNLVVGGTMAALTLQLIPVYGQMVAGLFDTVSLGLSLAQGLH